MNYNVSQTLETQRIQEQLEAEQIAAAGLSPTYLVAEDVAPEKVEDKVRIAVDISNIQASISSARAKSTRTVSAENVKDASGNYILNKPTEDTAPTPPPPPPNPDTDPVNETPDTSDPDTDNDEAPVYILRKNVTFNEDGTAEYPGYTVIDPDGTEHDFESVEEAEEYLRQQSEEHGAIVVGHTSTNYDNVFYSDVYVNGRKVEEFGNGNKANGLELAQEWVANNAEYLDDDLGYIYEYSSFDELDEDSTTNDVLTAVQDELDKTLNDVNDKDFYYTDENGFLVPDTERLQAFYEKIQMLCALLVYIQMVSKAKIDSRNLVQQEMIDLVGDKGIDTGTIVGKWVQNQLSRVAVAMAKLVEFIQEENKATYQDAMEAAEKKNDSCGDKTADFFSGGRNTIEMLTDMRRATDRYMDSVAAMIAFITLLNGGVDTNDLGSSDSADFFEMIQKGELANFASIPTVTYYGENDYMEMDDQQMLAIRQRAGSFKNLRKTWNAVKNALSESRNLVHEEMTGVSGRESSKLDEKLNEIDDKHKTQLFDMEVNFRQQHMSLYNQKKYLGEKLDAAVMKQYTNWVSLICTVAAIVVGIFCPWIGMVIGIFGAASKLYGEWWTNKNIERYKPNEGKVPVEQKGYDTGNVSVDILNLADNLENASYQEVDDSLFNNTKDGFQQLDFSAIAEIQAQLTVFQNLRKILVSLYKEKAATRKLVHMEMTGVGGREMDDYVDSATDGDYFKLEMLTFMLNEVLTAANLKNADDRAMDAAIKSFAISVGVSIGCAALGAGIGAAAGGAGNAAGNAAGNVAAKATEAASKAAAEAAARTAIQTGMSIGYGIGQALGGLIGQIYTNSVSAGESYGTSMLPNYFESIRKSTGNSTESRLDQLEVEIYEDMLRNGMVNSGDGNKAINGDLMTKLHKKLNNIANIKGALAMVRKAMADSRGLVHMEMTNIGGRKSGQLVDSVNRANAEKTLMVMNYLTRYVDQRIQVYNRAQAAARAMKDAWTKFSINIAIVGACAGLGSAWSGFYYLMSPIMQLFNSFYDMTAAALRANSDNGVLDTRNQAQVIHDILDKNNPDSTANRLERMEQEAYMEISKGLIEELGAGRWGINSGAMALMRQKMDRIFNIRDAFARIQAAMAESKVMTHMVMTGMGGRMSEAASAFVVDRMITQAMVKDLFRNLETMVQRHNQMNAEARNAIISAVMVGWAVLNLWMSVRSVKNQLKLKKVNQEAVKNKAKIKYYRGELKKAQGAGNKKNVRAYESALAKLKLESIKIRAKMAPLIKLSKQYARDNFISGLVENLVTWSTGMIYDKGSKKRHSKTERYESQAKAMRSEATGNGWQDSVAEADEAAISSSIQAGDSALDIETLDAKRQLADEAIRSGKQFAKQSENYFKSLRKENDAKPYGQKIKKRENDPTTMYAPGLPNPTAARQGQPTTFNQNNKNTPNSRVLLEALKQTTANIETANRQSAGAVMTAQGAKTNVRTQNVADLRTNLARARMQLRSAQAAQRVAVKAFNQAQTELRNYTAKYKPALERVKSQITALKEKVKQLRGNDPASVRTREQLLAQVKGLELQRMGLERLKPEYLKRKAADAKQKLAECRQSVQQAVKQVNSIIAEITRRRPEINRRNNRPGTTSDLQGVKVGGGGPRQVVAQVNSVLGNKRDKKNYYDMYREESGNTQRMAGASSSRIVSAA